MRIFLLGNVLSLSDRVHTLIHGKMVQCPRTQAGWTRHSALKLEKSAISKVQKHNFGNFKNGKKSIFLHPKKFKITKNAIFGLKKIGFLIVLNFFLVQKLILCHF